MGQVIILHLVCFYCCPLIVLRGNDGPGSKGQAELVTPPVSLQPLGLSVRAQGLVLGSRSHSCCREPVMMTAVNSLHSPKIYKDGSNLVTTDFTEEPSAAEWLVRQALLMLCLAQ